MCLYQRSKDKITSVLNTHEGISEDYSELTIRVRRNIGKLKCLKSGWIEEIEDKLRERK